MAALTPTEVIRREPIGDRFLKTFRVTSGASANPADEYFATGLSVIDAVLGYQIINTDALAVAASQTVTFIATNPTDADTITVGGVVYTINTSVSTTGALSVLLNTTEATMAANFAHAINRTGTPGTTYSLYVAQNPLVSASVNSAVVTLTARNPGSSGNAITLAASSTGATVGGATLTGGSDAAVQAVFKKNCLGTGQTEGTANGRLAVEFAKASVVFEVTVIGRP